MCGGCGCGWTGGPALVGGDLEWMKLAEATGGLGHRISGPLQLEGPGDLAWCGLQLQGPGDLTWCRLQLWGPGDLT